MIECTTRRVGSKIRSSNLLPWNTYLLGQLLAYGWEESSMAFCYALMVLDQWRLSIYGLVEAFWELSAKFPFLDHPSLYAWAAIVDLFSHLSKT